jgi:general secretion pathway protein E
MAGTPIVSQLPVTESFTADYLEYYRILPLELTPFTVRVAVAGEPNREALEDLVHSYSLPVELVPVAEDDLRDAVRALFSASESVVELVKDLNAGQHPGEEPADASLADIRDLANQVPVVRFVSLLIRDAHEARASDIHLEATAEGLRVRLRIDGVLSDLPSPPRGLQAAIVSRLKLLAELDIAERRAPQDGRIRARLESRDLDLRVSTIPTLHGESVVLRLLDRGGRPVTLDELGMSPSALETFAGFAARPNGIILATGPTGSGKTTTLYAALGLRHPREEKIITVEDPVEYHLPGITQMPVHARAGVTFPSALRSLLRQDPDVLMVGEMRDAETAGIAIQAAMTGHLVFSTLHTNDAAGALTRLTDLRVEPYMVAATVECILAQRLVRKICDECRESYRPDAALLALLAAESPPPASDAELQRGKGCASCRHTGFRGRTGIFEILPMTDSVRQELLAGPNLGQLRRIAKAEGMTGLRKDGWSKALAGITTVEEVLRVVA